MADKASSGVLVIGSANVDLTMGLPRLPDLGETVSGGVFLKAMGGKGANQAVAARRAGAAVSLVTCVGQDGYGSEVLHSLRTECIDLAGTRTDPNAPTGVAFVLYDSDGNNSIAVAPGANFTLCPEHLSEVLGNLANYRIVVLQNELSEPTLEAILDAARDSEATVLLNYAPAGKLPQSRLAGKRTGLIVNEIEAAALLGTPVCGIEQAGSAASRLQAVGFQFVVMTLGGEGCCVATATDSSHFASMPVKAIDPTAAGDTFCGSLAAALVENMPMPQAIRFAIAAAALATTRPGAQPSIPSRAEIEAALAAWPIKA